MKEIVKNANKDKVKTSDYTELMTVYKQKRDQQQIKSKTGLNEELHDGLNKGRVDISELEA